MPGSMVVNRARQRMPGLLKRHLAHTCTITPVSTGSEDAWGQGTSAPGTPIADVPCWFATRPTLVTNESGRLLINVPTLLVGPDVAIDTGDHVSTIKNRDDSTLESGPLVVETVEAVEAGVTGYKRCVLRAGDVR